MSLSKLKKIHVIIIGSFLCVAAVAALYFLAIKPEQEKLKVATDRYKKASILGCQLEEEKAIDALNKAMEAVNRAQESLDAQMKRRMPDLSFARRDTGMLALWQEQIKTLGPLLESFARDRTVTVGQTNFTIPAPPANPNDAIFDQDVLVFPLGQVTVQGDFKRVMNNMRRWNNCRRLVLLGPPTLQGTSPSLQASYNLTCYIFPVAKGGPKIPMAGGGAAVVAQQ